MEPTRISGPQGSQGAQGTQSARGKSQAQQAGGPVDPSAQGGFLALLASLDGTLAGDGLPLDTESDGSASQTAILSSDNTLGRSETDPASLAAWQSLLAPGTQPGSAVAGSVAGLAAGGGAMSGLAGTDWHAAADGLVAQTAMLDGAAEAAGAKLPNGSAVGYGRMFSRHHNALSQGRGEVSGLAAAATAAANGTDTKQALVTAFSAMQGTQAVVDARVVGGPLAEA